jgi:hypothetical protein
MPVINLTPLSCLEITRTKSANNSPCHATTSSTDTIRAEPPAYSPLATHYNISWPIVQPIRKMIYELERLKLQETSSNQLYDLGRVSFVPYHSETGKKDV